MKKMSKFLLVGMAAVLSFNALATPLHQITNAEKIEHQIVQLKDEGIIPKDISIVFNKVSEKQITEQRLQAEALLNISQETCNVKINATEDMKVGFTGSTENRDLFKSVTSTQTAEQEILRTQYLVMHEASHCKMYEIKDVFKTGDSKVDTLLNQFYKFSGSSYNSKNGDASAYYMLHENFADTHSLMLLLREHGPSTDVLKTIQQIQIERSEAATQHNPDGLIVHNTAFSIQELLKVENIEKTINLQSNAEVQEFALQIANKGMLQSLSNNNSEQVINYESLETGTMTLLSNIMRKDTLGKVEQSNISINWENNALLEIASNIYKDFKINNDISNIKTEAQFQDFYKNHSESLRIKVNENVDKVLGVSYNNGTDIISTINEHISLLPQKPILNIQQVKEQGIKDINSISQLANNFKNINPSLLSKDNILEKLSNISKLEQSSANQHIQIVRP